MTRWIYEFGPGYADGNAGLATLLGGKGAHLAEMASIGLPVPPGFTLSTDVCRAYFAQDQRYSSILGHDFARALTRLEKQVGRGFGDVHHPLLVSVRSGSPVSMPGMMDTVLNVGLNDETVDGLAKLTGNAVFAADSYRRLIQMYGDVVLNVPSKLFHDALHTYQQRKKIKADTQMSATDWRSIIEQFKAIIVAEAKQPFPQDVAHQLFQAVEAVFRSWHSPRAITYRQLYNIDDSLGTAATVQAMVFGNRGDDSATGVVFSRDPATGQPELFGEYLINAQGEDVVAGIRTPQMLTEAARLAMKSDLPSMERAMPQLFKQIEDYARQLEKHYGDMQDIEFTIEQGQLYILQTRAGKRTAQAAVKVAVDMVAEGVLSVPQALLRVDATALTQLLHARLSPSADKTLFVTGLPASPGAAAGRIAFSADDAASMAAKGEAVILVRPETSPEDIHGMNAAQGILTSRGGMTSHAAVVARGMGRACIVGANDLYIDENKRQIRANNRVLNEHDWLTIDGGSGEVFEGVVATVPPQLSGEFAQLLAWADKWRTMRVRANAETPTDVAKAIELGAEGIGLARTEHMFFDPDRIPSVRRMILADDEAARQAALKELRPMQQRDFEAIFTLMGERPVTIRLLDPPLHEFLPHGDDDIRTTAKHLRMDEVKVRQRIAELHEANPMLGHRGCRLGISFPEIYDMQVEAIFAAAMNVQYLTRVAPRVEIMIPLIMTVAELKPILQRIVKLYETLSEQTGQQLPYQIGTMIELPRAALVAEEIAQHVDFFSFGTNDLTQTTLGISRDDSASFMKTYLQQRIFARDPFVTIDQQGVGVLVKLACEKGRQVQPDLKLGVCGEHGGDPESVHFFHLVGLDYVSCSPYRIPSARLAAAQANLMFASQESKSVRRRTAG